MKAVNSSVTDLSGNFRKTKCESHVSECCCADRQKNRPRDRFSVYTSARALQCCGIIGARYLARQIFKALGLNNEIRYVSSYIFDSRSHEKVVGMGDLQNY